MKHIIKDNEDISHCIKYLQSRQLGNTAKGDIRKYSFECKQIFKKKTWPQIKLYFSWLRFTLMECGYSKPEANEYTEAFHCDLKKLILGTKIKTIGERSVEIIPSIKGFDKQEMTNYMNHVREYIEPKFRITLPLPEDRWIESFMQEYDI